jgi:hypothetical protein
MITDSSYLALPLRKTQFSGKSIREENVTVVDKLHMAHVNQTVLPECAFAEVFSVLNYIFQ